MSFNIAVYRIEDTLDYLDHVTGPSQVTTINDGSQYLLFFIDDSSMKVWVYFLKHENEVFLTFKQPKLSLENRLGTGQEI